VALVGPRGGEPFLAVYRRAALPVVRAALDAGTRRMQVVLAALDPVLIEEEEWRALDPSGSTLTDVDMPEDLERLS
jgi:molybdopterin-guanine dinucleotide biosynthesis protein A